MSGPLYWYSGYLDGPDGKWTCAATLYAAGIYAAGMCSGRRDIFVGVLHYHILEGPSKAIRLLEGRSKKLALLQACR